MTRKDYVKFANAFKSERPGENWDANKRVQWNLLVKAIADVLKSDNSAFRREQFIEASGGLFDV